MHRLPFAALAVLLAMALPAAPSPQLASATLPGRDTLKKYSEALEAARKQNDVPQQATSALLVGMAEIALQDIGPARGHLQESARLFESLSDHAGAWLALVALAELEKSTTDYDAAVATYERAVAVLAKAAGPGESFSIKRLQSIGGLFDLEGLPAPEMLPEALVKPILLLFADVMTRDGYGSALLEAGQLEEAEAELTRAQQSSAMFGGFFDSMRAAHGWESIVKFARPARGESASTRLRSLRCARVRRRRP